MADDDTNVISFRPRDGAPPGPPPLPPLPPARTPAPAPPPPPAPATAPPPPPERGADLFPGRARRSAADSLTDLTAAPPSLPPLPAQPAPAVLRSEGLGDEERGTGEPRLGALSLSAVLAVALAALRGTVTVVSDWRQRRMERDAEEAAWREARVKRRAAEETAAAKLAAVPSSAEFGRKAVQDGRKAAAGSGGSGSGKGGRTPAPGVTGSPQKKPTPTGGRPTPTGGSRPRPVDVPKPKPSGLDGKGGGRKAGKDSAAPGADKPGTPPSSGLLAPGKGKSGSTGKDRLGRLRDRKADDAKGPSPSGGGKPGRKGRRGAGAGDRPSQKGRLPGGTDKPGRAADGVAGSTGGRKWRKGGRGRQQPTPVKRVPGVKHGTADAHDVHECRCRRCVRAAGKRAKTRPSTGGPGPSSRGGTSRADRAQDRARNRRDRRTWASGADDTGTSSTPPPSGHQGAQGDPFFSPGDQPPPGPTGGRRSADEDLHHATAWTETVITVERDDRPGDAERRPREAHAVTTGVRSLPRAPEQPAGPRPGTTASTPKETPMAATPSVRLSAPAGVAAEHLTDVTLDDVLNHLTASKRRCFATYDECAGLAEQARTLRRSLETLADELRERHNVVGRLTARAMDRLAESMDVVARRAEQMRTESLTAAEAVETAHDAMHDAYRPVQDAAADAGLVMPSARIHNED
ncbi:hypothetical protein AB0957_18330 [Streptomyces zhihengii]|uniref:hypothetical protein n=1 Tax=Streptomyces zhihengii TaxID=1818004 RepID=UPI003453C270